VALTGVPIDHYVQLGFEGFVDLVDEAGGLDVAVRQAVRDEATGLDLTAAPCARLDGEQALALVRARRLEVLEGDTWLLDATGDLGRIARAQAVLGSVVDALGDTGVAELDGLSRVLADHAVLDDGLTLGRLVDLARLARSSADVAPLAETVPVSDAVIDSRAVLRLADGAWGTFESFGAPATGTGGSAPEPVTIDPGFLSPIGPCP
jgi:anionic cell wall polymer biosynthesis LytR-Cps2A-Psr (LCP) family protein